MQIPRKTALTLCLLLHVLLFFGDSNTALAADLTADQAETQANAQDRVRSFDIHNISLWQSFEDVQDVMPWQLRNKPWDLRAGITRRGQPVPFVARQYELAIGHARATDGLYPNLIFEITYDQIFRNLPKFEQVMTRLKERYGPPEDQRFRQNRVGLLWGAVFPDRPTSRITMPEDGLFLFAEIRTEKGKVRTLSLILADRTLEAAIRAEHQAQSQKRHDKAGQKAVEDMKF